jgi:hypothetical protein
MNVCVLWRYIVQYGTDNVVVSHMLSQLDV